MDPYRPGLEVNYIYGLFNAIFGNFNFWKFTNFVCFVVLGVSFVGNFIKSL